MMRGWKRKLRALRCSLPAAPDSQARSPDDEGMELYGPGVSRLEAPLHVCAQRREGVAGPRGNA